MLLSQANRRVANILAPRVDRIMVSRDILRERGDWLLADKMREKMNAFGIDIRDYPEGSAWTFDLTKFRRLSNECLAK